MPSPPSTPAGAATSAPVTEYTWEPGWRILQRIAAKEVSPVEVLDHFLSRIEALEPTLHAFDLVDHAGARAQAQAAEREVLSGAVLGPLHGVPIALKSHILVQGYPTRELMAPDKYPAMHDDIAVERLRRAGAIIVGHTTMPGMGRSPVGGGAFTDLEGHPRSPWDPTRAPGSSSAGSVAATAAAMLPLTIGSDGGGSTRLPSALTGVVGYHPTVGRIPFVSYRTRQAKNVFTNSTIGPITRDVRDVAAVMQVVAGPDGRDFYCIQSDPPDYFAGLCRDLAGLRLAWTDDFGVGGRYALPAAAKVISTVRDAAQGFRALGAYLEPTAERWEDIYEAMGLLNLVTGFGVAAVAEEPPAEAMRAAYELRARNYDKFRALFQDVDLLISPTVQFTAFTVEDWDSAWTSGGGAYPGGSFAPTYTCDTHIFNWLGFPAISIPVGFVDGLPVGLQIVGLPDREPQILQAAAAFTAAFPRPERPPVS